MTVVQSQDEVRRRGIKLPGSKRFEPPRRCEPEFPVRYPERGTACPELSIEQLGLGNDFERWHQHLNYALLLLRTHSGYGELDSSPLNNKVIDMKLRLLLPAAASLGMLIVGPAVFAADQAKPPMHMHKLDMDHSTPDKEAATVYKDEATMLSERAAKHRKNAAQFRSRGPRGGGKIDYLSIAQHCDKLATFYENAAKEAADVAAELTK